MLETIILAGVAAAVFGATTLALRWHRRLNEWWTDDVWEPKGFFGELGTWLAESIRGVRFLDDYVSGAATTGANKKEWVINRPGKICGVRPNSGASDRTTGSDVIDVKINGTSIWATAANRPTQAAATTGAYTTSPPDGTTSVRAGDVVSYEWATVSTGGTGKTRNTITIAVRHT